MKVVYKLFVLLMLAVPFGGCNDDNDNKADYAKAVEGTYKGQIKSGENVLVEEATITAQRTADNKIALKMVQSVPLPQVGMPGFEGLPNPLPLNVTCDSNVVLEADNYKSSGSTNVMLGTASIPVTVNGDFDKGNNATVNIGLFGGAFTVTFIGKKQ